MTAHISDPYFDDEAGTMAVTVTREDSDGSVEEIITDLLAAGELFAEHLASGQYTTVTEALCAEGDGRPATVDVTIGSNEAPEKQQHLEICEDCAIRSLEALAAQS